MKLITAITIFSSLVNGATSEGCSGFDNSMDIPDADGTFHYTIDNGVIQVCLEAVHDGWAAVGFSTDGKMISTTEGINHTAAVGGLPVGKDVVKLDLSVKAGYQPFSALETLTETSFEMVDDKVWLKFTKPLVEEGEVPISEDGENIFLYSWGQVGGFHTVYGHLKTGTTGTDGATTTGATAAAEATTTAATTAAAEATTAVEAETMADGSGRAVAVAASLIATSLATIFFV